MERWAGIAPSSHVLTVPGEWRLAMPWPTLAWLDALGETWGALSVALPFALATVIGGIDNTESAIAAGDRYRTRDILLTEALATILAGRGRRRGPEHSVRRAIPPTRRWARAPGTRWPRAS